MVIGQDSRNEIVSLNPSPRYLMGQLFRVIFWKIIAIVVRKDRKYTKRGCGDSFQITSTQSNKNTRRVILVIMICPKGLIEQ